MQKHETTGGRKMNRISIINDNLDERFTFTAIQFGEKGAFEVALWHGKLAIPVFLWASLETNISRGKDVWGCSNIKAVKKLHEQAKEWAVNQNPKHWWGEK